MSITTNNNKGITALSLQHVDFSYGFGRKKTKILKDVNIDVAQGTIYGLLGPSGCGKTTLLKCIAARLQPERGTITVFGKSPGSSDSQIPGKGIGYMPQELALYPELTIEETLSYFGRLHRMKKSDVAVRIDFLLEFLSLPSKKKFVQNLSGGEKRRVSFAIALLHQPPLLILDEPTVGVDPLLRKSIWTFLVKISSMDNVTVVITTHYIEEARQANKIALMTEGTILAQEEPEVIINNHNSTTLEDAFLKLCENKPTKEENHVEITNAAFTPPIATKEAPTSQENFYHENSKNKEGCFSLSSIKRINALTILNFIRMWRNFMIIIFQFLSPAIQVLLFYWSVGSDPKDLHVAVYNQDPNLGPQYLHYINNKTIHQIFVKSQQEGEELVREGKAWAVMTIWPNFTSALLEKSQGALAYDLSDAGTIHVRHDNTDQLIFYTMEEAFLDAYFSFVNGAVHDVNEGVQLPSIPVQFEEPIYGPQKANFLDYLTPGLITNVIFFLAVSLTAMSFVNDKKEGLLDRTFVSGASGFELLCGHIFTQLGVVFIQIAIVIGIATQIFEVENKGSMFWLVFLALSQGLCGMTFGFVISTLANDGAAAMMMAMGSYMPIFFTSGCMWPLESMPKFLQYITQFQPITLPTMGIRWIFSHGKDITFLAVWRGFLVNFAWIAIFLIVSVILMRVKR